MNKTRKTYSLFQLCSAIFMILALMWLTVSAPFVLANQQQQAKHQKTEKATPSPLSSDEEESNNPLSNGSEEKAPNTSNSFSEEYLHTFHIISHFHMEVSQYHKHENSDTYIAFHGELLVPPPNAA